MTSRIATVLVLAATLAPLGSAQSKQAARPWRNNVNLPGGDYRVIDMYTSDPGLCKAACEKDAPCKAWTFVKPEEPGGRGYCWLKDSVPEAIREDCCVSARKGEGLAAGAGSAAAVDTGGAGGGAPLGRWRSNTDLPGSDYRDFEMRSANPGSCQSVCNQEARCKAWTYVKPNADGGRPHCWLKDSVPDAIENPTTISGVKGELVGLTGMDGTGTNPGRPWRENTNLPGGDYRAVDLYTSDPGVCKAACEKDTPCKAWTFVKPEEPGGRGYCWLKDSVPEAIREACCVSALKGEGGSGGTRGWRPK